LRPVLREILSIFEIKELEEEVEDAMTKFPRTREIGNI
jgi:hypothetical protein